jgi:hypothetical protein
MRERFFLLLIAACLSSYLPFLSGGWLTDDFVQLTNVQNEKQLLAAILTPSSFHFYRPIPQVTLWVEAHLFRAGPVAYRAVNWLLHGAVVWCVYVLARMVLTSRRAASLATLAFALTPKANPIAVLWVSARSELLMSLFSLASMIFWLRWNRTERLPWLLGACTCYAAALLSKETAVLLPVLLLLAPHGGTPHNKRRWHAAAAMFAIALGILALRAYVGAAMPTTSDPHYGLMTPPSRWLRNLEVYIPRAIPSAAGMIVFVALPAAVMLWRQHARPSWNVARLLSLTAFAIGWFLVFMLPVLPIPARSELYLYFPTVGLCLVVGSIVDVVLARLDMQTLEYVTLTIYILVFGGYQLSRSRILHEDLIFSLRLANEVRQTLGSYSGSVVVVPADLKTAQFLTDSVWGYGDVMLKIATGRRDVSGSIDYEHEGGPPSALRLDCEYAGGKVHLRPSLR